MMNIFLPSLSSFIPASARPPSLLSTATPCFNSPPLSSSPKINYLPLSSSSVGVGVGFPITAATNEESVCVVEFEEFVDKDWSFLEFEFEGDEEHMRKIDGIISGGSIKESSRVLVSIGCEAFVDRIVDCWRCEQLFVVHESLLVLACMKEKHDKVKCWQGEVVDLPEKWTAFDALYLYFLPALSFELDQLLEALAKRCLPGARVVISHPHGKKAVEEQQQQYPDVVVLSNLPDEFTLRNTAANHSFQVLEFVDEPGFYLAVIKFDQES